MSNKIDLFYYNKKFTKPFIFFITKIVNANEELLLQENTENIFKILIDNNLTSDSNILIFNIIKEHESKIINWILPSIKSNQQIVKKIENNKELVNKIVTETIKNSNCDTIISLSINKDKSINIHVRDCNINLGFLSEIYF
jgi:hypothetical protein